MKFAEYLKNNIILFDGAMGTEIQKIEVQDSEWGGYAGCNEMLSLSAPHHIAAVHRSYLEAGADVIETNTFGANRIVLTDYGLEERTREINRAAARLAADVRDAYAKEQAGGTSSGLRNAPRFVAGSIGPGTKLPSLGQVDFDTIHFSYLEQARGLIEGGVDLFIIETCQDILQIKAAVIAVQDALKEAGTELPIIVSMTVQNNGSMLVGSDIPSAVTALAPLGVEIIGINCATGPTEMRPHIEELSASFNGTLFCMPNAGFPVQRDGRLVYDLPPKEFADLLTSFVTDFGVDIIGGCCGSDPDFIAELRSRIPSLGKPARGKKSRQTVSVPALSSLYSRQELRQEPAPFFVGERINSNGSKLFRTHLLEEDWDAITTMGLQQLKTGAHGIDVCAAYAGRDERRDMVEIIRRLTTHIDLPLVIDSTNPEVIEAALKLIGGRSLINSVNLENGDEHADRLFFLARRYGAAIIALTIDEQGMARGIDRKIEIARRLYDIAVKKHGLSPSDLVIDPLTFTLGSGDQELKDAGWQTIEAVSAIKRELPGVHTILGVSNISYGLSPHSREVLNSVFLSEAVQAGLDMAIVNVHKIIPIYQLSSREKQLALHLIYNRGQSDPLLKYIDFFSKKTASTLDTRAEHFAALSPEEQVRELILEGNRTGLTDILDTMLQTIPASKIISDHLIPAMKRVGELFGEGSMQLPFVLQSAEVMKKAVDYLEPFLERHEGGPNRKIVLATVRGDVHDIGKNLVDIILSNNGYTVINLGIKVDIETIIEKTLEADADAIGMSGLLVKSTQVMKANLQEMRRRDIHLPVLLGGAALTEKFVREECAPLLNAPVCYCRDAFDGLQALDLTAGEAGPREDSV
ncbi:MAG: homocysteine S-methyltransferase family protein, partial [Spirochaetota bacterium]|nr:homocysteine S-methyltransferase family protein [Spirochaetota bacterium]